MRKIYLFNNTQQPGWGSCYSITDDGVVLGNHICSDSRFMYHDLYLREDRKNIIDEYFKGEPYEVVIVPDEEVLNHPGLKSAHELNIKRGEAAKEPREVNVTITLE